MVTRIDPPQMPHTPVSHRRAEESDTKQEIRRHDPDQHRRKKDDDENAEPLDIFDDLADVSIPALRGFLQTLLAKIETAKNVGNTGHNHYEDHHAHRTPANPKAAAAMAAYQTRAATSATPPPAPPPIENAPVSVLDAATLNLDRAELLSILRDLDTLESRGVTGIPIERGDGFLASIRAGMAKALAV